MSYFSKTYKCVNCGTKLNPMKDSICPICNYEQPLEKRAEAIGDTVIDIECKSCGNKKSFYRTNEFHDTAYCTKCGATTYWNEEGKEKLPQTKYIPTVECPYCHSHNTNKISKVSKAGSVALFGIFSIGKVSKQWHCNECKSDF